MGLIQLGLAGLFFIIGMGLLLGQPENWHWPAKLGHYVAATVDFMTHSRPLSIICCFFMSVALVMLRKPPGD